MNERMNEKHQVNRKGKCREVHVDFTRTFSFRIVEKEKQEKEEKQKKEEEEEEEEEG